MGKPIAGQNQFPYTIGGFLVDGANINGETFAKKLYIHKQRSYNTYDLIDVYGKIYRFIRIGYQDTDGNMLNYFDVSENLVETIPINTFFLKIQDSARNIFSFVRIYQWHKCITVEGDYIFRTPDIDPTLGGVLINPTTSTIQVGRTLSYKSLFFPAAYPEVDGSWYLNSLNSLENDKSASIESTNLNTAIVKGVKVGQAVLSFVPDMNNSLATHSIVNIVDNDVELEFYDIVNKENYNVFKFGQEYTVEVVTYPYEYNLNAVLSVTIADSESSPSRSSKTELVRVSDDFKSYTFVTTYTGDIENEPTAQNNPEINFSMDDPFEYDISFYDITISGSEYYGHNYDSPGIVYTIPTKLRPNMTHPAYKWQNGPNVKTYPYVSSDPSIATFDHVTGVVTTYSKKGTVTFMTQYESVDGDIIDYNPYSTLTVMDEVYDRILAVPQKISTMAPGESMKFTFTGYREGLEPVDIPVRESLHPDKYTISSDGTVTIATDAPLNTQVYIWPDPSISIDTQVLDIYRSPAVKPLVQPTGTNIPMTHMDTTVDYYNKTLLIKLQDEGFEDLGNIIIFPRPYTCSNFEMQIDSYDNTIVEVVDEDFLLNAFQYSMRSLYMFLKPLKRGSTEMVISSVLLPDIKTTFKIIVY